MVHELGRVKPRTTKDLLDIVTSHASGEEAVRANFNKGKAVCVDNETPVPSCQNKKNKKGKKRPDSTMVGAVDRSTKPKTGKPAFGNFEKLMEGPCWNHGFPVKHLFKDCKLMKRYLKGELRPTNQDPQVERCEEGKDNSNFPELRRVLPELFC